MTTSADLFQNLFKRGIADLTSSIICAKDCIHTVFFLKTVFKLHYALPVPQNGCHWQVDLNIIMKRSRQSWSKSIAQYFVRPQARIEKCIFDIITYVVYETRSNIPNKLLNNGQHIFSTTHHACKIITFLRINRCSLPCLRKQPDESVFAVTRLLLKLATNRIHQWNPCWNLLLIRILDMAVRTNNYIFSYLQWPPSWFPRDFIITDT